MANVNSARVPGFRLKAGMTGPGWNDGARLE